MALQLLPTGFSLEKLFQKAVTADRGNSGKDEGVNFAPSASLLEKIYSGKIPMPKGLTELGSSSTEVTTFSAKVAASLGIPLGSFAVSGDWSVFVQDFSQYKEFADGPKVVRIGVGVRYRITFRVLNAEVKVSTVPAIAAAVQLGLAQASAKFDVLGLASPKFTELSPTVEQLDVETYSVFSEAMREMKKIIWDKDTTVTPVPLAVIASM